MNDLRRVLRRSFFGNLAGSLFIVFLMDESLLFAGNATPSGVASAIAVSIAKVRLDILSTLFTAQAQLMTQTALRC